MLFMVYQMMFAIITPALITRSVRRAEEVQRLRRLRLPVVDAGLPPALPLGVGRRRLDLQAGRPRLRRRHGRPHQLGRRGARSPRSSSASASARESERFEPHNVTSRSWAPPCSGSAGSGSTPARPGRQRDRGQRPRRHQHRGRRRVAGVARHRLAPQGRTVRRRRRIGRGGRPGGDHAGIGLRRHQRRARDRLLGRGHLLRRDPAARAAQDRRALDVWAVHGVGGTSARS